MRLHSFLAASMDEARAHVRAELGPHAVIVESRKTKAGLMVRAAVEQTAMELEEAVAAFAERPASPVSFGTPGSIRRLHDGARNFDRAGLLQVLRNHRTPDALAHALAEAAEKTALTDMTLALASALDQRMKTQPIDFAESEALLLAGLNGAGKSATAAKIAAHANLSGRAVELITTGTSGVGAIARDCAKENILAVIDTAGFDPRNAKARNAFAALTKIGPVETIGVVSAMHDSEEMTDIVQSLASLGARRIVVTGLDLTRKLGALLSAVTQSASLAYVTRSPYATGGLETLTPLSLARALIDTGQASAP